MKTNLTLKEKATAFLARHATPEAAVIALLTDNQRYREKLRGSKESPYQPDARVVELEGENQRLEAEVDRLSGQLPAQGAVVLAGDDVKAWETFKALGKADDVKKIVTEEVPTLRTTVAETARKAAATDAATILGWNAEATSAAIKDKDLVVTLVDGKNDKQEAIKIPHVRLASDEKAAPIPLTEWVEKNAAYLKPALAAKPGNAGGTGTQQSSGTPFPVQHAGGSSAATPDPVADFQKASQEARAARPNPLFPTPSRTAAATT